MRRKSYTQYAEPIINQAEQVQAQKQYVEYINNVRAQMVFNIRKAGVMDNSILQAFEMVPREMFVANAFQKSAYSNVPLPIHYGQFMESVNDLGLLLQSLEVNATSRVLEIGTGSGYSTSILSKIVKRVYTTETNKFLLNDAERRFHEQRLNNVVSYNEDGYKGIAIQAPFDRIISYVAYETVPAVLLSQLSENAILIMPYKTDKEQILLKILKYQGKYTVFSIGRTDFYDTVAIKREIT